MGADISKRYPYPKNLSLKTTPIHVAANDKLDEILKFMCTKVGDAKFQEYLKIKDSNNSIPIQYTQKDSSTEQFLLSKGSPPVPRAWSFYS